MQIPLLLRLSSASVNNLSTHSLRPCREAGFKAQIHIRAIEKAHLIVNLNQYHPHNNTS